MLLTRLCLFFLLFSPFFSSHLLLLHVIRNAAAPASVCCGAPTVGAASSECCLAQNCSAPTSALHIRLKQSIILVSVVLVYWNGGVHVIFRS